MEGKSVIDVSLRLLREEVERDQKLTYEDVPPFSFCNINWI